jgi:hypothetical protein
LDELKTLGELKTLERLERLEDELVVMIGMMKYEGSETLYQAG